jgi:hypothetical protein
MVAFRRSALVLGLAVLLAACQAVLPSRVFTLATLNNSGVTGTVTLTAVDDRHTSVEIQVNPAGHDDMPAHVHPGTCPELVSQPKYPLQNVKLGHSTTVLAASLEDLTKGGLAVNIHNSNEDMRTYTACADLR